MFDYTGKPLPHDPGLERQLCDALGLSPSYPIISVTAEGALEAINALTFRGYGVWFSAEPTAPPDKAAMAAIVRPDVLLPCGGDSRASVGVAHSFPLALALAAAHQYKIGVASENAYGRRFEGGKVIFES